MPGQLRGQHPVSAAAEAVPVALGVVVQKNLSLLQGP